MPLPHPSQNIPELLANLRTSPIDTENILADPILATINDYFVSKTAKQSHHWYCDKADDTLIEAATFLIRLFAYEDSRVHQWKTDLNTCLSSCYKCNFGFERAKEKSCKTYLATFPADVQRGFFSHINEWEGECIAMKLISAGVLSGTKEKPVSASKSLSAALPILVYRILNNVHILRNPVFLAKFMDSPPEAPFKEWAVAPIPSGLLLLSLNRNEKVRAWAKSQRDAVQVLTKAEVPSIALQAISGILSPQAPDNTNDFALMEDTTLIWSPLYRVMRFMAKESLVSSPGQNVDLRRLVLGHLHDTNGIQDLLSCFRVLISTLHDGLWTNDGPDYPQVVFDSIKDNTGFIASLTAENISSSLNWLPVFLSTTEKLPTYSNILSRVVDFLCEELQHERFQELRPSVMSVATELLKTTMKRVSAKPHLASAFGNVLDIHAEALVSAALAPAHDKAEWQIARAPARSFLQDALLEDVQKLEAQVKKICDYVSKVGSLLDKKESNTTPQTADLTVVPLVIPVDIRRQYWRKVYATVRPNDTKAIAMLITTAAQDYHLSDLHATSFGPSPKWNAARDLKDQLLSKTKPMINAFNEALQATRDGFSEAIQRYTAVTSSTAALELLQEPHVAKAIMSLMVSPCSQLHDAAQSIVGLAFEVDVREDCFRALLENLPDSSLEGILDILDHFVSFTKTVPEACALATTIVRCFTDIISVLCSNPDGLLRIPSFLRAKEATGPASKMRRLWSSMNKAIAVLCESTPGWAVYYSNEEMVVWMRDAIIFGREMVDQRKMFEQIANARMSDSSKAKENEVDMLEYLQSTLASLLRWLRLTDEELLYQAFSLLDTIFQCFRDSKKALHDRTLASMNRLIDAAKKEANAKTKTATKLDPNRLRKLVAWLALFTPAKAEEPEDDTDVVEVSPPPKHKVARIDRTSRAAASVTIVPTPQSKVLAHPKKLPAQSTKSSAQTSKSSTGKHQAQKDQARLDAAISASAPTFRRTNKSSVVARSNERPSTSKVPEARSRSVSSSSSHAGSVADSDSDEQETQVGLSDLAKKQKSPVKRKAIEQPRRQIKMLDSDAIAPRDHARIQRQREQEAAHRLARRMQPNLSGLHRALLSWDYDHPDSKPPMKFSGSLNRIPDVFRDPEHYRATLEPLALLDCWAQLCQSKEETLDVVDCSITARAYVDAWLDLEILMSAPMRRDWYLADTDVILLRHPDQQVNIIAKVESARRSRQNGLQASIRCIIPPGKSDPGLNTGSKWRVSKIFSLSTVHREYSALVSIPYYDFCDQILKAELPPLPKLDARYVQHHIDKYKVNEPQAKAICSALKTTGFSLIQGPPGTGKTSTICGLVAASMDERTISVGAAENIPRRKILICAPSNAAIDEITKRLISGTVAGSKGVNVVRVGADAAIHDSVKDVSLESLVNAKLGQKQEDDAAKSQLGTIRSEISQLRLKEDAVRAELQQVHDNAARITALQLEGSQHANRRKMLARQHDELKDKLESERRGRDADRRRAQAQVLKEADVICSTLSGAGHVILEEILFEMIVIDEAAQAIELSSLIPLRYSFSKCVMVGDPQQLPPTVISREASQYLYNQSLFVRLQKQRPEAVHLLSIQYRMHPEISRLPSSLFYSGRLQDGPGMDTKTQRPWQLNPKFGTYRFFNINGQEENSRHSVKNNAECQVALALYDRLAKEYPEVQDRRIGIVSMYKAQVNLLKQRFEARYGHQILQNVDFNTVDGFQGQEKDIIILSCVRAGPGLQNIGFLADVRRMNVALTRAKSSVFILGNAGTLDRSDENWKKIVADSKLRLLFNTVQASYFTEPATASTAAKPRSRPPPQPTPVPTPADLVTPKQMALSQNKTRLDPSTSESIPITNSSPENVSATNPAPAPKRKADDMEGPVNLPARPAPFVPSENASSSSAPPKVAARPPKPKPKQPPNIFINSNNKKRPAGGSGGPPQNKRRID